MRWRSLVLFVAVCGAAGCPKPTDPTPPIAVSPKAPARISLIRSRSNNPNAKAKAHPMTAGDVLGGANATGKAGDWMLENDEVVFVIDGLGGGGGFAESGGNLVDAADARIKKDELGQLFTYFGTFPRQGVYTKIEGRAEQNGFALVEARGTELYDPTLTVVTQYRLGPNDRALLMKTMLTNTGAAKVTLPALGDAIQWGATEKTAPGKALGFKGPFAGPYVGGIGRFVSYGLTSTTGEMAGISGGAWTDTEQVKNVEIAPGGSVTYERVFVVGERADSASIVTELMRASSQEVGGLEVALVDARGAPVRAGAGAKVFVGTAAAPETLSLVAATEGGTFGGELPPGSWVVSYAPSVGRRGDGKTVTVDVKQGAVAKVQLAVTDASEVTFGACREKSVDVPCKITIEGIKGTPTPFLGPAHVSGPARHQITLAPSEVATVPLANGRYVVSASRGPEYDVTAIELEVPVPDPRTPRRFDVKRVVDTSGYVAGDFHQHTILSADAATATRDRVIANAAEGVEVAVATEHNVVADLSPIAKELGLAPFLVSMAGNELTSDASKNPWGHANVYPLAPNRADSRGGAIPVRDKTAQECFAAARAVPGPLRVLQVNHPRAPKNGYFELLGFDPKTGLGTGPGYDPSFDAIEIWSGRRAEHRSRVLEDFFALIRTSHPATPIADTDTHGIVGQEAGYPRTYVRVAKDDALDAWSDARTADLVSGIRERRDVVLTNGPFLSVTANGAPIGGVAKPKGGGIVDIEVAVQSAPWVVIENAELRLVGGGTIIGPSSVPLGRLKNAAGAWGASARFSVKVAADDALVVIVSGNKPMKPVLGGDDVEIVPWAMSGPIWIDADGDGKSLGRR